MDLDKAKRLFPQLYVEGREEDGIDLLPKGYVPISLLSDPDVSIKAKGVYAFLSTFPKEKKINLRKVAKMLAIGVEQMYSAVKDLLNAGYLSRKGKMFSSYTYHVNEYPDFSDE